MTMQKLLSPFLVWIALLVLLAMTVAASFILRGPTGLAVSLGIAFAKAGLVYWFFMHLSRRGGLERIAAIGAGAWIAILLAYVVVDYLTR